MNYQVNYIEIVSGACIPLIIALTAIAFPLLLQTVSRIDDKYSSTNLVKVFYKDKICKSYLLSLVVSIIAIPIWFFAPPRIWDFGMFNKLIENSSFIIIALSTIFLVLNLFSLVYLIYKFYSPSKLLDYLIEKLEESKNENEKSTYFISISDLLYFSIQNPNEKIARRLLEFFSHIFISERKNKENKVIIYPPEYYDTIFEANEQLCLRKKKTISYYNDSTLVNLFIDSYQKTILSEETYKALWICLRQALNYGREDIIVAHWENAHQHLSMFMPKIQIEWNEKFEIINQDAIDRRELERERFLEFHYALGGLIMYLGKMSLLKRIMAHTNQTPPKYVLVPDTMIEVLNKYMSIEEPIHNPFLFESRYSFPDISGINKGGIIRMWIRKYCALLFLRQYTLHDYYYGKTALDLPNVPNSLRELNSWKDKLESLKRFIEELLEEKELLNDVGLGYLTNNWFDENEKQKPSELIDTLIKNTKEKYESTKQEQPVSKTKEAEFKEHTKEIVLKAIDTYSEIENAEKIESNFKPFHINGVYQLMEKAGFADDQDVSYLNSDTFVAESVASNFHFKITSTFSFFITKRYVLNREDIFKAIDRLGVNLQEYCIISFGVYLPFLIENLKVPYLSKKGESFYFRDNRIISLDTYVNDTVRYSIVVVRKTDLPKLNFNKITEEEFKKYSLEELDERTHLSASIIDLNSRKDLRDEISQKTDDDLTKNVLACISIGIEARWKLSSKCYQFKPFDQFNNRGVPDKLEDINPINEKTSP
ncbi:hypothetical protein [uncultured Draconibacterium sp.]|uniref:hypothetical protein n=1 Tax=uncultured Draconibacterium sp. TaxID=1573823 RepID=UPI0029C8A80C|nr:hypothetical protein [uncultured Draconibacterium sp.]